MVRLARQRLGDTVRVILANLESPLDFLADASFDLIVCPLVMDYIRELVHVTFIEFYRLLRSEGCLVFSIGHPFYDYDQLRQTSLYFDVELVQYTGQDSENP